MVLCSCQAESERLHPKTLWTPDSGTDKLCILHDNSAVQSSRCVRRFLPSITHIVLVIIACVQLLCVPLDQCFRSQRLFGVICGSRNVLAQAQNRTLVVEHRGFLRDLVAVLKRYLKPSSFTTYATNFHCIHLHVSGGLSRSMLPAGNLPGTSQTMSLTSHQRSFNPSSSRGPISLGFPS